MKSRRDEDESRLVEKYAEYRALESSFGAWGALFFLKLPVIGASIFAIYMIWAWQTQRLNTSEDTLSPEQKAVLEENGRRFTGRHGVSYDTYQWDENGHLLWVIDSLGNKTMGDPGKRYTQFLPRNGASTPAPLNGFQSQPQMSAYRSPLGDPKLEMSAPLGGRGKASQ